MIDTEALRKKIIDLAIQGKLTQQLPEDGNAEDLYAKAQEEKAKLIKAGKIKTEKLLPVISNDEVPFDIPDNWKWVYCRDVMLFINGRAYKKEELLSNGRYPVLRVGNFFSNEQYYYSDLELDEDKYCKNGDLLYAWSASFGPKIWCGEKVIFHYHIWKINMLYPLNTKYIYYYLLADTNRIKDLSHGIGFVFVTKEFMERRLMPIPPLEEQERIVERIEEACAQIDIIDALQQRYESDREILKGKIIDAGISGKLTEQLSEDGNADDLYAQIQEEKAKLIKEGKIKCEKPLPEITEDEIPFVIPNNWKWVRLGDVIRINSGTGLTSQQMGDGDIPVYGGNGVAGYHNESLVDEETIVIGRVGYYCGSVHVTPEKAWITDNAFITTYPKKYIDRDYLFLALKNMNLGQNTNGAAQPVVSGKKIYPLLFALPPLAEQKRIAKKIDDLLNSGVFK